MENMDDVDKIQGNDKDEKSRTRILWTCACSYLIPLIFLLIYIFVRIYLNVRYH
jgi:hypothetical protein